MFGQASLALALVLAPLGSGAGARPAPISMSVDEGTFGWSLSRSLYAHRMCKISTADLGNAQSYYDQWATTHAKYATPQKIAWEKDNALMWAFALAQAGGEAKVCAQIRSNRKPFIDGTKKALDGLVKAHAAAQTQGH